MGIRNRFPRILLLIKMIIIIFIFFILIFIMLTIIFRVKTSNTTTIEGRCYFAYPGLYGLPHFNHIVRDTFESLNGKHYMIINRWDDNEEFFWLNDEDVKHYFNMSTEVMSNKNIQPVIKIKAVKLLSGYYEIISIQKLKWVKGMTYNEL